LLAFFYHLSSINYHLNMSKYTWILDNGHGGVINGKYQTEGKRSPTWADGSVLYEGEFNRDVVRRLAALLTKHNINYVLLTPQDADVSLQERCVRAARWTSEFPCVLVSIHANYFDGKGTAHGWEVWTTKGKTQSDKVAVAFWNVFNDALKSSKVAMRGDWEDGDADFEANFYLLQNVKCPAILTENFFMDNLHECSKWLLNADGRQEIAELHFKAIQKIEKDGLD
jgi:N-acetylmuramoyl-L-alanine amidase